MRLKLFLICFSLLFTSLQFCQNNQGKKAQFVSSSFNSFEAGEWIKFRIHYGIFNASYATIDLKDTLIGNQNIFKSTAIGRTTGIARLFFKVDDIYESYFEKELVRPIKSKRDIYEGGYTKNIEINYDYSQSVAVVNDIKNNNVSNVSINKNVQDIISTFYFLRNHFDVTKLEINDFIKITMFFDAENYDFRMKFLGFEDVKTKFGVVNCYKFRPYIESGRVFRDSESLALWVSNDKNKIPIKIEAQLRIGSIEADLDGFKGLKHPFKIKVNE